MTKILLIGKDGRLHCIADALVRSSRPKKLYTLCDIDNPGLIAISEKFQKGKTDDLKIIESFAISVKPDFAVIGPEEPLVAGVVDLLTDKLGIPCIGPSKKLAQVESSKAFTRKLLSKYGIPGNPEYRIFYAMDDTLELYLREKREFVIKPDGLTGGKGVKVFGVHLYSTEDALEYCKDLFGVGHQAVIIEEKLDGEEFTLQSFCDGKHIVDTIVVQDHKLAYEGDTGSNTGGMGSYSCEDHSLPFLSQKIIEDASRINAAVATALASELGQEYKGILYGGFMITKNGLRLIEYNARFGDPEVMNVLPLLKTDFIDVCEAIINGTLDKISIEFEQKATVCKYVVPDGYPDKPDKNGRVTNIPTANDHLRVYYAAVNEKADVICLTGSRAIAFVGIGNDLKEAERIADNAAGKVRGPVRYRRDIGTYDLIKKRIDHIKKIMGN